MYMTVESFLMLFLYCRFAKTHSEREQRLRNMCKKVQSDIGLVVDHKQLVQVQQ